jgi:hypothetical protein
MSNTIKCDVRNISDKKIYASHADNRNNALLRRPQTSQSAEQHLSCDLQNNIPVVHGVKSSYFIFQKGGKRLLILTRKKRESIVVGRNIDVVVLEINGDEVKLGIICPGNIPIHCLK